MLRPGGRFGLVIYTSIESQAITEPEGNHFPTSAELGHCLTEAGLQLEASIDLSDLPDAGPRWDQLADAVEREIAVHHHHDPEWQQAEADQGHVSQLLQHDRVRGLALRTTPRRHGRPSR